MPPKKEYNASVLVIDVGATSSGSGFLTKAVRCASEMVQRKVYSEASQRYGLVLVGTRKTDNELNYPHVCVPKYSECGGDLVVADFDLIKFIEQQVPSFASDVEDADWLDGVVVAVDRLVTNTKDSPGCKSRNVIVLTDMGCKANDDKLWNITEAVKEENIDVTFILPKWQQDEDGGEPRPSTSASGEANDGADGGGGQGKPKTKNQEDGCLLLERLSADWCDIETAHSILLSKERRKKRPMPWKVDLEIGPDLAIPTLGYIRTRRENPKTWKKVLAERGFEVEELKAETTFIRDNEDQEVVEPQDLVDAYKYGSEILPVSSVEQAGAYEGGPKRFSLVGFAKVTEIPTHLLAGDGSMFFKPDDFDEYSVVALSSFTEAMIEEGMAAIVRRVYNKRSAPKIGVLIPEGDEGSRALLYVDLPFSDDLRHFQFAPLWNDKTQPTADQLKSIDDLIDATMLPSAEESPGEALETENILHPYQQHLYKCLTARALNPSKGKAPKPVDAHTMSIMQPPSSLVEKSSAALATVKDLFKLEPVAQGKLKQTGDKLFGDGKTSSSNGEPSSKRMKSDDLAIDGDAATSVGTTTPVDDFQSLLSRGFLLESVATQMEKVVMDLLRASFGEQLVDKILGCLTAYREACIELRKSLLYNTFVQELKTSLLELKRDSVWKEIVAKEQGLISSEEEPGSKFSTEECSSFIRPKVEDEQIKDISKEPHQDDEMVDDLLDDL